MLSQIREDLIEIVEADAQMRPVLPTAGVVVLEVGPTRNLDRNPESPWGKGISPAALLQTGRVIVTSGGYHDGEPAECEYERRFGMGL
jgi:hypothetical protein